MAARELTAQQAAARLERRGGRLRVQSRVRETGRWFPTSKEATYLCVGREDGVTVIVGPDGKRWLLRTDVDRASLATDMEKVKEDLDAHAGGRGLVFAFSHIDELQADGGYGQVGCVVCVVSTVVGLVLGLAVAWLATGQITGYVLVGPIVGFVAAMFTSDFVGGALASVPALRDRVVDLVYAYEAVTPALITFLVIVVGSARST